MSRCAIELTQSHRKSWNRSTPPGAVGLRETVGFRGGKGSRALRPQEQGRQEADLVARLQAGEEAAFEALLARYQHQIYRFARRLTRNREDAEEVVQDTFFSVYRKIRDFKGRAALGTWLYRIAANSALMLLRRRRPEPHLSIEEELPRFTGEGGHARPVADWSDRPDDPLLAQELRQVLQEAIAALPPIYKAVVVLRDIEGLSNQEAAEALGTTVLAVKSRLHRAHLALRERLGSYIQGDGGTRGSFGLSVPEGRACASTPVARGASGQKRPSRGWSGVAMCSARTTGAGSRRAVCCPGRGGTRKKEERDEKVCCSHSGIRPSGWGKSWLGPVLGPGGQGLQQRL